MQKKIAHEFLYTLLRENLFQFLFRHQQTMNESAFSYIVLFDLNEWAFEWRRIEKIVVVQMRFKSEMKRTPNKINGECAA